MGRVINKLTETAIKHSVFEKQGKRQKLADGGGLYLDIQRAGRYWRMKYRYPAMAERKSCSPLANTLKCR